MEKVRSVRRHVRNYGLIIGSIIFFICLCRQASAFLEPIEIDFFLELYKEELLEKPHSQSLRDEEELCKQGRCDYERELNAESTTIVNN